MFGSGLPAGSPISSKASVSIAWVIPRSARLCFAEKVCLTVFQCLWHVSKLMSRTPLPESASMRRAQPNRWFIRFLRELLKMELFDMILEERLALSHKQAAVRTASNAVRNADRPVWPGNKRDPCENVDGRVHTLLRTTLVLYMDRTSVYVHSTPHVRHVQCVLIFHPICT